MANKDLTDLVRSISVAEEALINVEEKARELTNQSEKSASMASMEYEIKNKYAMLEHHFVGLAELLDILYPLRRSLTAPHNFGSAFEDLIALYKGATVLGKTKKEFPPSGVYVDLDRGTCATRFHDLLAIFAKLKKNGGYVTAPLCDCILKEQLNPLIGALEDCDTPLEKRDATVGIFNKILFEEVHSARWVEKVEDEPTGHYEMRNMAALSIRPFVDLALLLPILYSWRIALRGNWLGEKANHRDQLLKLLDSPLYLLKDPKVRFPAAGVYIDLARNCCDASLMGLLSSSASQSDILYSCRNVIEYVEDYESRMDDPTNGIYDRTHFEKHFSAKWILD